MQQQSSGLILLEPKYLPQQFHLPKRPLPSQNHTSRHVPPSCALCPHLFAQRTVRADESSQCAAMHVAGEERRGERK